MQYLKQVQRQTRELMMYFSEALLIVLILSKATIKVKSEKVLHSVSTQLKKMRIIMNNRTQNYSTKMLKRKKSGRTVKDNRKINVAHESIY